MPRGRPRKNRTPEEEEIYRQECRKRKTELQRLRRQNIYEANRNLIQIQTEEETLALRRQRDVNDQRRSRANAANRINLQLEENISNIQQRNFSSLNVPQHYLGSMNVLCCHCGAKHFEGEKVHNKGNSFNDCCSHGAVKLPENENFPEELKSLFMGNHEKSKAFFQRIRVYNNSLSFASLSTTLVDFRNTRPGPFLYKIQGQMYYKINTTLFPEINQNPSHGQLFIIDPEEALSFRMEENADIDPELMKILDKIIRENNIFANSYQMMYQEVIEQWKLSLSNYTIDSIPEVQLLFTLKPGMDRNRYNFQRTNEVAAVFTTTAEGEIPESYVTIRNVNTKKLEFVSSMDPNVEPWIYPLFFPNGNQGWHRNLNRLNSNRRITRGAYTKYQLAIRPHVFTPFLFGGRLTQQFSVDMYVKMEQDRIKFCKDNQKKLRSETYKGLIDHLQNRANNSNSQVGKVVILPSTFIGSPRNMMQNYQDSMSIVRKFGRPDLFVTMTCNPNWPEIQENLFPGQTAADRPDLVARVFSLKKDHLIFMIKKQFFFGGVAAYVYVIEFQKRGLPHVHLLITLKRQFKLTTPARVDKFIYAEIPTPEENTRLHNAVMKHMIHGPCGDWCMVNNKCSKNYPMDFQNETIIDGNGYPLYMRRDTGKTYRKSNRFIVDNRNVVPYNPELLLTFDCHINVVAVSSVKSIKYIHKYIYKGHDAASITINNDNSNQQVIEHDEIHHFLETRYVGPTEACWRILSKNLQEKSHSIVRLPVHLPNEHNIIIDQDENEQNIQNALINKVTMLIDYFELNKRDIEARNYLYIDIPNHYIFKQVEVNGNKISRWEKRKNNIDVIGRMYSVSPTQMELFHLRLLLLHVKGATSFEDLRTVDGVTHPTFVDTCLALDLIEDDEEWRRAMQEACLWMMPKKLRDLFVRILIHCQPLYPEKLWDEFKEAMSEDLTEKYGLSIAEKKAYAEINNLLIAEGRSLKDFPSMNQTIEIIDEDNEEISLEYHQKIGEEQYAKLNEDQKKFVDIILDVATNENTQNKRRNFFIEGQGGSGKTFVYTTIYHLLKAKNIKVRTMAYTGIAAILLPNGITVHKTFGIPVPTYADSTSNIKIQSKEAQILRETDVFIWDEAPMAPKYTLEICNRLLQDIMQNNLPFGGKIFILGGDFRQLLPVKIGGTRSEVVSLSIKYSTLWTHFEHHKLNKNMRVSEEEREFCKYLLDVGDGKLNDNNENITLPESFIAPSNTDIVDYVYAEVIQSKQFDKLSESAILSARNVDVDEINKKVVELLDKSTENIYTSIDSAENCDDNGDMSEAILPEYLNSLSPSCLPPYELILRKNTVVMLIRNISIKEGLCNGTRLRILDFSPHLLKCEVVTGDKAKNIVFISRITLFCENDYPFTFKRRQFPIKLAFAMTINKAQGQTFQKIGIDLRRDVFTHGQLYVALSRVRSENGLKVFQNESSIPSVKNYVFKEIYA